MIFNLASGTTGMQSPSSWSIIKSSSVTVYRINPAVSIDFRKAFDKVSIPKLIAKLKYYGIRGNVSKWLENFLTGRTQKIRINNAISEPMVVSSGVSQGSVLRPLLFIMFINDIGNNLESDFLLYADDLKLFGTNPDSIAKDLDTISSWCDNWQMTVAPNKCECIRFSHIKKYAKLRSPALSIDGV
uniref:Reverse transcriptase domain-containing protein n=1 Tax=Caenorhabditis japonica TaxID=281687 RepID=A0A8R1HPT1_CAEJA